MAEPIEVEFVDRDEQLRRVREMRRGARDSRILLIKAPLGMGKTWVLRRAEHEHRDLCTAYLSVSSDYSFADDPIDFIQHIANHTPEVDWTHVQEILGQVGQTRVEIRKEPKPWSRYSRKGLGNLVELIRKAFRQTPREESAASINFADHADIKGDVFTGDKIEVNVTASDDPFERERKVLITNLSDAFVRKLSGFRPESPILLLLDDYDQRTSITGRWLLTEFLTRIRDGTLRGVLVVIAGREIPEFDRDWKYIVESTELQNFPENVVRELWTKSYDRPSKEVMDVYRYSGGKPDLLAQMADNAAMS